MLCSYWQRNILTLTAAKFHYSNLFGWIKSNKGGIDGYTTIMLNNFCGKISIYKPS